MKIKLDLSPVKILRDDNARLYFSHDESEHWLGVIETNYGYEAAERIHVILIELLENAVFHNKHDESDIIYELEIINGSGYVRVSNMVDAEQKEILINKIGRYANSSNLDKEYAIAMSGDKEGGLGLLRLMTEQGCKLRIYERNKNYIEIEARIEL